MENKSGLHPCGQAVLVEPYEPEVSKSVIVIPPSADERAKMMETRATVIEIGPSAWHDEPHPRAKPGDKVLIGKLHGVIAVGIKDGKTYRIINGKDIYCQLEE